MPLAREPRPVRLEGAAQVRQVSRPGAAGWKTKYYPDAWPRYERQRGRVLARPSKVAPRSFRPYMEKAPFFMLGGLVFERSCVELANEKTVREDINLAERGFFLGGIRRYNENGAGGLFRRPRLYGHTPVRLRHYGSLCRRRWTNGSRRRVTRTPTSLAHP
jgi:hypothetical protein